MERKEFRMKVKRVTTIEEEVEHVVVAPDSHIASYLTTKWLEDQGANIEGLSETKRTVDTYLVSWLDSVASPKPIRTVIIKPEPIVVAPKPEREPVRSLAEIAADIGLPPEPEPSAPPVPDNDLLALADAMTGRNADRPARSRKAK